MLLVAAWLEAVLVALSTSSLVVSAVPIVLVLSPLLVVGLFLVRSVHLLLDCLLWPDIRSLLCLSWLLLLRWHSILFLESDLINEAEHALLDFAFQLCLVVRPLV